MKTGEETQYGEYTVLCLSPGNYAVINGMEYYEFIGVEELIEWIMMN